MKTVFYCLFALLLSSFVLFSCGTLRNSTPSEIGLLPLPDYRYTANNPPADTMYAVYQNEETFNRQFTASSPSARRPGFNGQWVVGVILPASSFLRFERAEVAGAVVNVYMQTCMSTGCSSGPALLATIPNVGNAKRVRFFVNGEPTKEVTL